MNEIKAFIRAEKADLVINALSELCKGDITLLDVMGMGKHLTDPHESKYSIEIVRKFSPVAKVEMVCKAEDTDCIVDTLRKAAYTGLHGDGMIYVSPVLRAVKIRTGVEGEAAL